MRLRRNLPDWWSLAVLLTAGLTVFVIALASLSTGPAWGFDFRAYYDAAVRLTLTGTPYQAVTMAGPFSPGPEGLYLYSPVPALVVETLTGFGPDTATLVWFVFHVLALVLACALLPVSRSVRMAVFAAAIVSHAALRDVTLGNVSVIVTLLTAVAWHAVDRPASGVAIAVGLFLRPQLALLGVWALLRRQYCVVAAAGATALVIFLASLPFVGLGGWHDYVTVLGNLSGVTGVFGNADLGSMAVLLGVPVDVAVLLLFAGFGLAIGAVLVGLRRDRDTGFVVTAMASLLLSPLLWDHYLTLLILPAALLADRGRRWGVLLPLLSWLPLLTLPLVAIAGTLLPFLVAERPNEGRTIAPAAPLLRS